MKLVEEIGHLCPAIELPWLECDSYLRALKDDRVQEQEQEQGRRESDNADLNVAVDCKRKDSANAATEQIQEPRDYSHLYILKNQHNIASTKPAEYISLPSSSDEDNYSDDDDCDDVFFETQKVTVAPPWKNAYKDSKRAIDYQPANVGLQQANSAKKRRKN